MISEQRKQYLIVNRDKISANKKRYYLENKESIIIKNHIRYETNKEISKEKSRKKYSENKNIFKERVKKYQIENKEKVAIGKRKNYLKNIAHYKSKNKEWRMKNPDRLKEYKLKLKYNISMEIYKVMLQNQKNLCAICNKPETSLDKTGKNVMRLAVDHNHITGKVRGLLCGKCNMSLG